MKTNLNIVTLKEYKNLGNVDEWLMSIEQLPPTFLDLIDVTPQTSISQLLKEIRYALDKTYHGTTIKPKSFAESRFTSATEAIEKHLSACGIVTNIFGTALRHFGVPVQYVHGKLARFPQNSGNRHAWLKIYNPQTQEWIECDAGHRNFDIESDAIEVNVYHNWQELKSDYNNGQY